MTDIAKKDLVIVRGYNPAVDEAFLYATWLRSFYYGNIFFSPDESFMKDDFMKTNQKVIGHLLSKPTVKVRMACLKDSEDVILGYAVIDTYQDKNVLHYVFIKQAWRGIGLREDMIPEPMHITTHMTKSGRKRKPESMIYNPYLL